MSDYIYALSYMVVGGTTLWCIFNSQKWKWIYGTYVPLCIYSLAGFSRYVLENPRLGDDGEETDVDADAYKYYNYADKFAKVFVLPYYVSEYLVLSGYYWQFAYLTAALPVIPVGILLIKDEWNQDLADCIVVINAVLACVCSFVDKNVYGVTAIENYLTYYFGSRNYETTYRSITTKVINNFVLCCFIYYAYKALEQLVFHYDLQSQEGFSIIFYM